MAVLKIGYITLVTSLLVILNSGCGKEPNNPPAPEKDLSSLPECMLSSDKSAYAPSSTIVINSSRPIDPHFTYYMRYRHLSSVVEQEQVTSQEWTWKAPSVDYQGYLGELVVTDGKEERVLGTIGIDVSSSWTRFPRYGFLSSFGSISDNYMQYNIDNLTRYHINALQYYDCMHDHHRPLAGSVEAPAASWQDIIGRVNQKTTIDGYIAKAREKNMASMFYDLCYGVLNNGASDGVEENWYIFKDSKHLNKDVFELGPPFRSNIYLVYPGNDGWLDYFSQRVSDVYSVFDFDGYHIDQLGSRGEKYDYFGETIDMPKGFGLFLSRMSSDFQDKYHVFNAVGGYGQSVIAQSGADVLYNEVWGDQPLYSDLKAIIDRNNVYGSYSLKTVLAAYMNYDKAEYKGTFNTPGVLMTDAVIFACGGDHLELGEHMLGKEYFPNNNLSMDISLTSSLVPYYDFITAYQNLLRDGGEFNDVSTSLPAWPPVKGNVVTLSKKVQNSQVIHLLNYTNALDLSWRDVNGTQKEQLLISNLPFHCSVSETVQKVWVATPDLEGEMYKELDFSISDGTLYVTIPWIKYWTMLVIE